MSVAAHMARFSGQFALDLGTAISDAGSTRTLPSTAPTLAVLVAAALENELVLHFIETRVPHLEP